MKKNAISNGIDPLEGPLQRDRERTHHIRRMWWGSSLRSGETPKKTAGYPRHAAIVVTTSFTNCKERVRAIT